jgi:hypothetical protein
MNSIYVHGINNSESDRKFQNGFAFPCLKEVVKVIGT